MWDNQKKTACWAVMVNDQPVVTIGIKYLIMCSNVVLKTGLKKYLIFNLFYDLFIK